jgi:hypothetical protein
VHASNTTRRAIKVFESNGISSCDVVFLIQFRILFANSFLTYKDKNIQQYTNFWFPVVVTIVLQLEGKNEDLGYTHIRTC